MSFKPSENEEKFFTEMALRERLRQRKVEEHQQTAAEKRQLKELHWLHCPKCGQQLAQEHYGRVEVDVCPECRGLWLDAHELETILAAKEGKANPFQAFLKVLGA